MKQRRSHLSAKLSAIVLIAALFFTMTACSKQEKESNNAVNQPKTYSQYMQAGNESFENARYDDAAKFFTGALEQKENDIAALKKLSKTYYKSEQYDNSIDILKTLQQLDKTDPYSYNKLIQIGHKINEPVLTNKQYINAYKRNIDVNKRRQPEKPYISLDSGTYKQVKYVKVSTDYDSTIYYSLKGEIPTKKTNLYNNSILFDDARSYTLTAAAYDKNGFISEITTREYTFDVVELNWTLASRVNKTAGYIEDNVTGKMKILWGGSGYYIVGKKDAHYGYCFDWFDFKIKGNKEELKRSGICIGVEGIAADLFKNVNERKTCSEFVKSLGVKDFDYGYNGHDNIDVMSFTYANYFIEISTNKKGFVDKNDYAGVYRKGIFNKN